MKARMVAVVTISLFLCLACSCRRGGLSAPSDSEIHPDMVMTDASYTIGQSDRQPLVLKASRIEIWTKGSARTEMAGVSFSQCSKDDGTEVLSGSCDSAVTSDETSVSLKGNVRLYKADDNVRISCDSLHWDDKAHIIMTDGDITVIYSDGTSIEATGFSAELDTNTYSFVRIKRGVFSSDGGSGV